MPLKIVVNKCNHNQSFKITIKKADKDQIFRSDIWEKNIIVKPFRERRYRDGENWNGETKNSYGFGYYGHRHTMNNDTFEDLNNTSPWI